MSNHENGWRTLFETKNALWIHDENPKRPHALLTSGKHSNGFFNSELIMEDPMILDDICYVLVSSFEEELVKAGSNINEIDRVVGPAMGAITLANGIAWQIARRQPQFGRHCLRAYVEKEDGGESKKMVFKRTAIRYGERILLVEDVLTTGGSVELATQAIFNVNILTFTLPFVVVIVNRSGLTEVGGKKIISLIDHSMPTWESSDCPLCKSGSEAIRPKGTENWARLNAKY
jgi:orotate phosphoribosyltransferase